MSRPTHPAFAAQERKIAALQHNLTVTSMALDYIARCAGLTEQVRGIRAEASRRVTADAMNPGQPVPDPASQPAAETTEQAVQPEAFDNVQNPGQTPGSVANVPADATGTPMDPGTTLPTAPFNNLQDVTAPVAGTETHVPNEQTRTEVDVRVGDPMNPQVAFPWGMGSGAPGGSVTASASDESNRTMASMRLARLRIQAGTAQGNDDLAEAARIQAEAARTTAAIEAEISTLDGVIRAAASRSQVPTSAVPRAAAGVQRTTPSLVSTASTPSMVVEASASDSDAEDIFLDG